MKNLRLFLIYTALGSLIACAPPTVEPNGTQLQATSIQQSACIPSGGTQNPGEPEGKESYSLVSKGDHVEITYKNAPFRCDQEVTWEASLRGQVITATVRPKEMNPTTVARCNCNYDLTVKLGPLSKGKYTVKIQHQTDNYGSPSTTKEAHSADVEIP